MFYDGVNCRMGSKLAPNVYNLGESAMGSRRMNKMRRILFSTLISVFAFAVFASPGTTRAAGQVSHYRFAGNTAQAYFQGLDPSGCVETRAEVIVIRGQAVYANRSSEMAAAFVTLSQMDFCTPDPTRRLGVAGSTELTAQQFQLDNHFDSAWLNTELELCDFATGSGLCFPVTINLNWSGTGRVSARTLSTMMRDAGLVIHSTIGGVGRGAQASGSISDGTTNFVPANSVSGSIGAMKEAQLYIQH